MSKTFEIHEAIEITPEKVDKEKRIVSDVVLLRPKSANKRRYTEAAMRGAVGLYEGARVFWNHAKDSGPRDPRDLVGAVRNVRFDPIDPKTVGDIHFLEAESKFGEIADEMPDIVGMSHHADGTGFIDPATSEEIVEAITVVKSVDVVVSPATTSTLFESKDDPNPKPKGGGDVDYKDVQLKGLQENRPDIVKEILAGVKESDEAAKLQTEVKKLRESNDELTAKATATERARLIESELKEAELVEALVTETFRQQLVDAKDEDAVKALVKDRKEAYSAAANTPKSRETQLAGLSESTGKPMTEDERKAFAANVRGAR